MANERLRRAILDAGFSTFDLALEVGTDAKTVERWITNGRVPHPRNRAATARVLGVDELVLWPELAEPRARAVAGSEVVHVYPHRGAVAPGSWYELLMAAERHIDVLVFAGLFLADGRADLPALEQAKADEGVTVRLLLGDPTSEAVTRRGEEERVGDALAARIRLSMVYLEPVLNAAGVHVRLHDTTLYNSIYRFDADMLVNTHAYGAQAAQSPVMHLRRDREGAGPPLFPTHPGGRLNPSNIRNRLLNGTPARNGNPAIKGVVERANEKRTAEGRMLLPARVTPHTLRRTFASLCFLAGRDLRWVMGQLGHDDPRMTLAVYAQTMKRKRIDRELVWALMRFPDEPGDPIGNRRS